MRVRVNGDGLVVAAADDMGSPFISFPTNRPPGQLVGMQVITGLSGLRLLVEAGQVIAREDGPAQMAPAPTGPVLSQADIAAAVAAYLQANPPAKGDPGPPGLVTLRLAAPVAVPALIVGATTDVVFTWSTPLPSATYSHDLALAPALIGKVTVALKTRTAAALTVTLTSTALVAAGASVAAAAWA